MIRTALSHGRGWLEQAAADSLARLDATLGRPVDINSAGRTAAEQQAAVDRMNAGGPFALPVGQSVHEKGRAIDSDDLRDPANVRLFAEHGWTRTALARGEWWHAEYDPDNDQHEGDDMFTDDDRKKLDHLIKRVETLLASQAEQDDTILFGKRGKRTDGHLVALVKRIAKKVGA